MTAEAAGAPTAAAAAVLGPPRSLTPQQRECTRLRGAPLRPPASVEELQDQVGGPGGYPGGPPDDEGLMLHSCRSTDSEDEGPPSWSYLSRGAPSYPSPSFTRETQGPPGAPLPLRRPSPPARGPLWFDSSARLAQGPLLGAPTGEGAPVGAPRGAPMQYPLDYRVLAEEAREALETARKKKEERQGVGASELFWDPRGAP